MFGDGFPRPSRQGVRGEGSAADNYHGSGFSGVDGKQRFTLPVDLRRRVKAGSGDHNVLFVNMTPALACPPGFGEDHLSDMKQQIEDEVTAARARGEALARHRRAVEAVASVER